MTTDEQYLDCPFDDCGQVVWVSPEDPDASLHEMARHLRRNHPGYDLDRMLADVTIRKEPA